MKKLILVIFLLISVSLFPIKSDISPKHDEGPFLQFSSIGYAWQTFELSTIPLLWPLGLYNLSFRYYGIENSIIDTFSYIFDPGLVPSYTGQPREGLLLLYNLGSYYHTNYNFDNFSIKPHFEINNSGMFLNDGTDTASLNMIWLKISLGVGYYSTEDLEIFSNLEGGILANIFAYPETPTDWEDTVNQIKSESLYFLLKAGVRWYYDEYSAVELGYRFKLKESPLMFLQGFTVTDWLYNIFGIIYYNTSEEQINIPFITTDYYLTFSAKF
ncbi:MAG: hypothetical protein H0Z24_07610 [Thermosipho sp. (in: Bacteria)]|nr:hypothetical protein [Thermosipho sp. (in: thermotogales)]